MKTKQMTLAMMTSLLALTSTAYAEKVGNGGGAIVCGNPDGSIQFASLLDLMEAEENQLTVVRSNEAKDIQLERALNKLSAVDSATVSEMRKVLSTLKKESIPQGKALYPPSDTGLKFLTKRKNCSAQGLGNFDDKKNILEVDFEIEMAMSQTDQAAFDFHEAYYKVQRMSRLSVADSLSARKVTGAVFAQEALQVKPVTDGLEEAQYVCETRESIGVYVLGQPKLSPVINSIFYIVPHADRTVRVQFTQIAGSPLVEKTAAILDPLQLGNEDTVSRFREGLGMKHVKKESMDLANRQPQVRIQSDFGQSLVAQFTFDDVTNRCGINKLDCSHFFSWTKPSVIENFEVRVGFYVPGTRRSINSTGIVSCKKL